MGSNGSARNQLRKHTEQLMVCQQQFLLQSLGTHWRAMRSAPPDDKWHRNKGPKLAQMCVMHLHTYKRCVLNIAAWNLLHGTHTSCRGPTWGFVRAWFIGSGVTAA